MKFFEFIQNLDRRWVFLLILIVVTVPFFMPLSLPIEITPSVKHIYDRVEEMSLQNNPKPILISADFGPEAIPELNPMLMALLRHCMSKKIPVITMTLHPAGPGILERAVAMVADEYNAEKGKDYVSLGFGVGSIIMMLQIGEDIKEGFPNDYYGNDINDLPLMDDVKNYDDMEFVFCMAGSGLYEAWITYAKSQYNATIATGVTGTMATDAYPFLQSGQLLGLIGGLKGAAEYETLIDQKDAAYRGMDSQSASHILIIILVILGNIASFVLKEKKENK